MTWDNGDRTVLVNPNLRGITLGWNLQSTAQDELFAAIEGTAFHTRVILDRMAGHGVHIKRVINAGGIPQKNDVLNRVYANVLGRPVLVPRKVSPAWAPQFLHFLRRECSRPSRKRSRRFALPTASMSLRNPNRVSTNRSTRFTTSFILPSAILRKRAWVRSSHH